MNVISFVISSAIKAYLISNVFIEIILNLYIECFFNRGITLMMKFFI
jgi:hypothetical protein